MKPAKPAKPTKLYKDTIHNHMAEATNQLQAWALIRSNIKICNYKYGTNLQIPTQNQIIEVTD